MRLANWPDTVYLPNALVSWEYLGGVVCVWLSDEAHRLKAVCCRFHLCPLQVSIGRRKARADQLVEFLANELEEEIVRSVLKPFAPLSSSLW